MDVEAGPMDVCKLLAISSNMSLEDKVFVCPLGSVGENSPGDTKGEQMSSLGVASFASEPRELWPAPPEEAVTNVSCTLMGEGSSDAGFGYITVIGPRVSR